MSRNRLTEKATKYPNKFINFELSSFVMDSSVFANVLVFAAPRIRSPSDLSFVYAFFLLCGRNGEWTMYNFMVHHSRYPLTFSCASQHNTRYIPAGNRRYQRWRMEANCQIYCFPSRRTFQKVLESKQFASNHHLRLASNFSWDSSREHTHTHTH